MDRPKPKRTSPCHGRCLECDFGEASGGGPSGWRLALPAAGVFLLPLGLAVAGAALGGRAQVGQLLGAMVGLAVGLVGCVGVARLRRHLGKEA